MCDDFQERKEISFAKMFRLYLIIRSTTAPPTHCGQRDIISCDDPGILLSYRTYSGYSKGQIAAIDR